MLLSAYVEPRGRRGYEFGRTIWNTPEEFTSQATSVAENDDVLARYMLRLTGQVSSPPPRVGLAGKAYRILLVAVTSGLTSLKHIRP